MPSLHQTLVRPLITEKSSAAWQDRKEYVFEVHPDATKYQIRDALQALFGVTVTDVRTMQVRRNAITRGRTRGVDVALEEGHRDTQGRRLHRRVRGLR